MYKLIKGLQILPLVICIMKIHIKNQPLSNLNLPNYSFVHVNTTTNAGGVAMYLCDNLNYKIWENQYQLCNSEAVLSIINQADSFYVIQVIYCYPSQVLINAFFENQSNCLTDYNKHNKNYFILGYLDINTFTIYRSPDAMHFINMLISCRTFAIITKLIRITDLTAMLIDPIITNVTNYKIYLRVIETSEVSDNYLVFCQLRNIMFSKKFFFVYCTLI